MNTYKQKRIGDRIVKAIISRTYGTANVLKFEEFATPVPTENQVLVRVRAASLNFGNLVLLRGKPFLARFAFGLTKPKYPIPGGDISGQVKAVGKHVTRFKTDDDVFGDLSSFGWGGFAEYVAVSEDALALKPANLTYAEAAASPMAGVTALQGLRKGKLQAGENILIHGASGGVGTFAVQLAKVLGAEVTGVCSTKHLPLLRSIGVDHLIDYTEDDFSQHTKRYDLILGVNGSKSLFVYQQALNPHGRFIHIGGSESQLYQTLLLGPLLSLKGNRKMSNLLQRTNLHDLQEIQELLEQRKITPVIDQCYPFEEIAEAYRYFEKGHAKGKVVITLS